MTRRPSIVLLVVLAVAGLAACGSGSRGGAPAPATPSAPAKAPPRAGVPTRVAIVVLENRELPQALGPGEMPYLSSLARHGASATRYFALRHPSLPNYIALVTGRTAGITTDCTPSVCPVRGRSIVDQLEHRGISWGGYMEGLPQPCWRSRSMTAGRYAQKHNPFAYLSRVSRRRARCEHVVPLTRLARDERRGLPRFTFLSPDLCHDAHDCPLSDADAFLRRTIPGLLRGLGPRGLLLVTFDEGTTDAGCCGRRQGGGRIALVAAGPLARPGARWSAPRDHRSTPAEVEDLLGLPRLPATRGVPGLGGLVR